MIKLNTVEMTDRGHCWQVQEVEGVLEGAGRPTVVEDIEYQN